jgi:hypothetical protein
LKFPRIMRKTLIQDSYCFPRTHYNRTGLNIFVMLSCILWKRWWKSFKQYLHTHLLLYLRKKPFKFFESCVTHYHVIVVNSYLVYRLLRTKQKDFFFFLSTTVVSLSLCFLFFFCTTDVSWMFFIFLAWTILFLIWTRKNLDEL